MALARKVPRAMSPIMFGCMDRLGEMTPMPLPPNPIVIQDSVNIQGGPSSTPDCYVYTVVGSSDWFGWFGGWSLAFSCEGQGTFDVGIWGPDPQQLGPPWGRMAAPKVGQPDAASVSCKGNFKDGKYYILVRSNGQGPNGPYTLKIVKSAWVVFGKDKWDVITPVRAW
jgi:hypothetical protein